MTEKEKRDRALLYDATDPELVAEMAACRERCTAYNALTDPKERAAFLSTLLGHVGQGACIQPQFWCDYGYNIFVGDAFFANYVCVILDAATVTFGNSVFIGPNCGFYTATHPLDRERRKKGLEWAYPITVGDDVWIGGGVTVLPGVTIGSGTVVGAGSVVTHSLPPNVVAFGNPCRVVRENTGQ